MTYEASTRVLKQIENNFVWHKPFGDQATRFAAIRGAAASFAHYIASETPESREQSLALTALEECVMWANAAIARNEVEP